MGPTIFRLPFFILLISLIYACGVQTAPDLTPKEITSGTSQSELPPWVDVKAFGARGDGKTDDTAAINKAIAVGGEIYFPAGTYKLNTLTIEAATGLKLRGAGPGKTVLDFSLVTSGDGLVITYNGGGSKLISVHDLEIKDSRGQSAVSNLIRVEGGTTGKTPSETSAFIDIQRVYASQHNNSSGTILLVRNISHMAIREFYTGYRPQAQYALIIDNDKDINTGVMTIENSYLQASRTALYIHRRQNLLDSFIFTGNFLSNYPNPAAREAVRLEGAISALVMSGNHIECRDSTETACVLVDRAVLTASDFTGNHISAGAGADHGSYSSYGFQFSNSTLRGVSFRANEFLRVKNESDGGACYRFENDSVLKAAEPVVISGVYRNVSLPDILSIEAGGNEDAIWNGVNVGFNEVIRSLGAIPDDGIVSLTPPYGEGIVYVRSAEIPSVSAVITYRAAADGSSTSGITLDSTAVTGTGALTKGSADGIDAKLNINAHTDGRLYIKNRLGYTATVYIQFLAR